MIKRIACLILSVGLIAGVAAAEKAEPKEVIRASEITGEISVISRNYISIVYARDEKKDTEYEMMLPINEDVKFVKKRLDELTVGDKVRVKCDDYFRKNEDGKEICARRVPKEIQFLSPPINKLVAGEER